MQENGNFPEWGFRCGSVGRAAAPDSRDPKFETRHCKNLFGKIIVYRHIPRKVLNVEFDFDVRFSTLMQNLTSKIDKLGSRRRPTLS